MPVISFKTLAVCWSGLAGAVVVGAGVLQASYTPPPPILPAASPEAMPRPAPLPPTVAPPASVPFENRSLLAMLPPPEVRPHPAPHAAAAEPLPVPPIPPAPPVRAARTEPPRRPALRQPATEEDYAAAERGYPRWGWEQALPYPGVYASGRAYYYGARPPYHGWQPYD